MRIYGLLIVWLYPTVLFARLPPFYQTAEEMKAILNNPAIAVKMGPYPIQSLSQSAAGYRLVVENCSLDITLHYTPRNTRSVGPAQFTIQLGAKRCASQNRQ